MAVGEGPDILEEERARVTGWLADLPAERIEVARGEDRAILPRDAEDFSRLYAETPEATVVAGATDVGLWVTKFLRPISPALHISHLDELRRIEVTSDRILLGPMVSYADAAGVLLEDYPHLTEYWARIGGWQVRSAGTIGGNIANGSPIGDTPPVLIALGAEVALRHGETERVLPLEAFFLDYGKQDRKPGEWVSEIRIPRPVAGDIHRAWKISKRRDEDISSVAMGLRLRLDGEEVTEARIALGGMAGVPKRAAGAEAALIGGRLTEARLEAAAEALGAEFTPLTDWRASAEYRRLVAQNLLRRLAHELKGEAVRLERA